MRTDWKEHFNHGVKVKKSHPQAQVGRSVNQQVIDDDLWKRTMSFVTKRMNLTEQSTVLDLCCGNGVFTVPIAKKVKSVTAVDFSEPLLQNLKKFADSENVTNIQIINSDVTEVKLDEKAYTHAMLYFALQHFTEQQTLQILENISRKLAKNAGGGCFLSWRYT